MAFTWEQFHKKCSRTLSITCVLIAVLKQLLQVHLPGANELIQLYTIYIFPQALAGCITRVRHRQVKLHRQAMGCPWKYFWEILLYDNGTSLDRDSSPAFSLTFHEQASSAACNRASSVMEPSSISPSRSELYGENSSTSLFTFQMKTSIKDFLRFQQRKVTTSSGIACWNIHMGGLAGIILGVSSANERRHYYVMPSLIGRAHTQNDPWLVPEWHDITA